MRILITLSQTALFFQELMIRRLLLDESCEIFLQRIDNQLLIPSFTRFQKKIDYRFANYKKSPFEPVAWDHLLDMEGVNRFDSEDIDLHLDLSGKSLKEHDSQPTISPVFDMKYWMERGKMPGSKTVISVKSEAGAVLNSLTFSSERGVLNNTYKALYYITYLILKALSGERNPVSDHQIEIRKSRSFYVKQLYKLIKRKFLRNELNWKLAIRRENQFYHILNTQKSSFWADPFLLEQNKKTYVFFEELKPESSNGQISCVELDGNGQVHQKMEVLVKDFHLSFPNVFRHGEEIYMMPEQSESNRLVLYKASHFPKDWIPVATLMENTKIIDPEIIFYQDKYWLFCSVLEDFENENNERLSIFYSDELFSETWTAHAQNPVVIDKETARNAGKIVFEHGKMLRPAQNCVKTYGESISLREIKELTTTSYIEQQYMEISPPRGFVGLHTFNKTENWQIVDLLKKEKF